MLLNPRFVFKANLSAVPTLNVVPLVKFKNPTLDTVLNAFVVACAYNGKPVKIYYLVTA